MNNKLFLAQQMNATLLATATKIQSKSDQISGLLTTRQFMTLLAISHLSETDASYNQIANKLGTTKQNVKQLVNALEGKNYVTVHTNLNDKRAVTVKITKEGLSAENEWGNLGNSFLLQLTNDFTESELDMLWKLLEKLYQFDGSPLNGFNQDTKGMN